MSEHEKIPILVTGVGDTVGQALVKAALKSAVPCRVVGTDRDQFSVGLEWVHARFVLPHCSSAEAYLAEMTRICSGEGVRLIFPGSEIELELLSRNAEKLRAETGVIVVASPLDVLSIGMDKWETCRFLERAGLNFPRYARADEPKEVERLIEQTGFPLVAKPCRGTGARGVLKIEKRDELETLSGADIPIVLQEYLEPDEEEYSVEVYTLKNGRQVGAITYRRDQLIAGDTYKARVQPHPVAEKEACAVAAALGATGPCNVQLRVTARGPVTFEINPRFSGGVAIRAHFGYNEVEMALRDLVCDEPVPAPKIKSGLARRYWAESYVDNESGTDTSAITMLEHAGVMRILTTDDTAEWCAALDGSRQYDFHQLPQYHRVAELRGEGTGQLFVYREGGYTIALPLLLRPVDPIEPEGWQDATSVYGYGGPVASHDVLPDAVMRNFQSALADELARRRVIAVFSRLHPLIAQDQILVGLGDRPANGQTISIDLTLSDEEQRAQYNKSCRTSLRKLKEQGFVGLHDHEKRYLPEFVSVYLETMKRAGAQSSYFFDEAYFNLLTRELASASHLFVALKDGEVAAATLCTICNGIVQDHLGGTSDAFLKFSPDRLVVDTERRWAKEVGARIFHLGGGVGAQEDSVFRYKSGFSKRRHTFRTWRWVLQPDVYDELCDRAARWNASNGLHRMSAGYFPAYRCPTSTVPNEGREESAEIAAQVAGKEGCVNA